ncbi:MAG: hypothetical protein V5A64_00680 [Candidatus Thermoplasmatota archaeon]
MDGKSLTKKQKKAIQTAIFFIIITLPFLNITQTLSIDTFIDSFENPEEYICLHNTNLIKSTKEKENYLIIEKATNSNFQIKKHDQIIYLKDSGEIACSRVLHASKINNVKRYYITNDQKTQIQTVYRSQIVGKIIKNMDDNLWNTISINIWDISIHNLNINKIR